MNAWFLIPAFLAMAATLALWTALRLIFWGRAAQNVAGAFLLSAMACTLLGYLFQMALNNARLIPLWQEIQVIGLNLGSPASLLFILYFTGNGKRVTPVLLALLASLSAFPIIISLNPATNAWYIQTEGVASIGTLHVLVQHWGWMAWVVAVISHVEGIFGVFFLAQQLRRLRPGYRLHLTVLFLAQIFAFVAIWMQMLGINPIAPISIFLLSFIPTTLAISWMIFALRVGHALPLMREKVVETMHDSVIVLDEQNRAAYLNPAARRMFAPLPSQPNLLPMAQLAPQLAEYLLAYPASGITEDLATIGEMSYSLSRSVIEDWKGDSAGQVLVLRNVTDRERMEAVLQARAAELARSGAFTQALSQLAARVAASADLEQVYNTLRDELHHLGLEFCVALRTPGQSGYAIEYLSLDLTLLQLLEKYTGIHAKGFRLPELGELNDPEVVEIDGAIFVPALSNGLPLIFNQFPKNFEGILFNTTGVSLQNISSFTFHLVTQDEEIGMISIWGTSLRREDLSPLSTFAAQVSAAIQKARLIQNEHSRITELESTNRLILSLTQLAARFEANLTMDQIMEIIGAELKKLNVTCVIALNDPATDELVGRYTSTAPALWHATETLTGVTLEAFRTPYKDWQALLDPQADSLASIIKDPADVAAKIITRVPKPILKRAIRLSGITPQTPAVWLPLRANERNNGILVMWGIREPQSYLQVFSLFARQVATAIEKARLMADLETLKTFNEGIVQGVAEAIILFDPQGAITFANPAAGKLMGVLSAELVGKAWDLYVPPADREKVAAWLFAPQGQNAIGVELNLLDTAGQTIPVLANIQTILRENWPVGTLVSLMDIQQRIQAEQQIRASIEEKEALLKEIHHRVKNNLQIISSLLNLQASRIKDESMIEAFRESQNRVRSMALIHEKLYHSQNLAEIRFDEYIKDLTAFLMRSYNDATHCIQLEIVADPINLDIDTAIPCGLIINELVTNSIKHGLPLPTETAAGHICIRLALLPEQRIRLLIEDNGSGFPPDLDVRKINSLGLQLVTSLTHQLDGEVSFNTHHGAQVEINFTSANAYLS